jgi:hypothetical protein
LLRFFFLFFSADHGKVLKTINAASADDSSKVSSVVIEELDVLAKPEPIRNLKIVRTMQYGEFLGLMYHYYGKNCLRYERQNLKKSTKSVLSYIKRKTFLSSERKHL